eukprot:XP_003730202.1 PREDICTED: fibropellin-1 [Strongylocentrotus purpuratus]
MAGNVMTLLSFMIGIYSFIVLCQVQNSNAYPSGAVTSTCVDMTPNHGSSSQTSVSPYTISVSPAFYQPGEQMTVTISRNANTPALKGILLQVRRTGNDEIIGTWSVAGTTGFQTLACNGANSAVTHTSNGDKPASFPLNWTPPDVNGDDIYVTATFVQTMPVFWVAERTSNIQLMTPCDSDPCVNGGTCTNSADDTTYTCSCPPPFAGPTCQTEIDPCVNNTCANGTSCFPVPNSLNYTCACPIGLSGERCETAVSPCVASSCENGANCTGAPGQTTYTCTCPADYTGTLCETSLATTPAPVPTTPGDGQKLTHNIFIVATAICVFLMNVMTM